MNTELEINATTTWGDITENTSVSNTSKPSDDDGFKKVVNKKDKYNKNKDKISDKKEKKMEKKKEKIEKKIEKLQKKNEKVLEVPFAFSRTNSTVSAETKSSDHSVYDPSVEYKFTRPCNSLVKGEKCEKGLDCTFAHSIGQLKLTKCHFGSNCKNVISGSDCIDNANTGKVCSFLHEPIETVNMYCKRVYGFDDSKPHEVVKSEYVPHAPYVATYAPKTVSKTFNTFKTLNASAKPFKEIMAEESKERENKNIKTSIEETIPSSIASSDDKIVVDVPKDMAMQMLEMLVKSGKTNIEIRTH
jgi:hypothetical protein